MVDENLTDEQQADLIRQWFRENGFFILGGLGLGLALLLGWDQWQSGKIRTAEEASGIYEELVGKVRANDRASAEVLLGELLADYGGSPYIDQARFRLAKLSLDRNDFESAAAQFESVIAESGSVQVLAIARIRLARARMQQGRNEEALAALDRIDTGTAFYAQANDVRGDVYVAMNRRDEALAAYEAALSDSRQPPSVDRAWVQIKRDALGTGESVTMPETVPDASVSADPAVPDG